MLFGEDYFVVVGLLDFWVDCVVDDYFEQDSEGQGVKVCVGDGWEIIGLQGGVGQSGGQCQVWDKMLQGMMFGG